MRKRKSNIKKIILTAAGVLLFASYLFADDMVLRKGNALSSDYAYAPRLLYPAGEKATLKGKGYLEFKWYRQGGGYTRVREYDFRLYKGYDMTASNLIIKKILPRNAYYLRLESGLFENGQIYTWSVRGISYSGRKGERSFNSFKVIK